MFVIGGAGLIQESMKNVQCEKIYLTRIKKEFECDVFIDPIDKDKFFSDVNYTKKQKEGELEYDLLLYRKKVESFKISSLGGFDPSVNMHPEYQYLDCLRNIINFGIKKEDRTGTGILKKKKSFFLHFFFI